MSFFNIHEHYTQRNDIVTDRFVNFFVVCFHRSNKATSSYENKAAKESTQQ